MCVVGQIDGMTIDYTLPSGLRFVIRFSQGTATYWAVDEAGQISNRNDHIPYRYYEIRPRLIFAVCYERSIGDIISLVIDIDEQKVHSGALLGYPADDRSLQFEDGNMTALS